MKNKRCYLRILAFGLSLCLSLTTIQSALAKNRGLHHHELMVDIKENFISEDTTISIEGDSPEEALTSSESSTEDNTTEDDTGSTEEGTTSTEDDATSTGDETTSTEDVDDSTEDSTETSELPPAEDDYLDDQLTELLENEVIVYTAAELQSNLTTDNGKNVIYFGADIKMPSSGITVNRYKGDFILDGTDPLTGERHTLTDYGSSDQNRTIYINNNTTSKNITVRNMDVVGLNYYGFVSFTDDASRTAVITYQNINYTGPQLVVIRLGQIVIDDCNIHIIKGTSPSQEVAEVAKVTFRNNVEMCQLDSNGNAMFWVYRNSSFTSEIILEPGANVTAHVASQNQIASFVYGESSNVNLKFGKGSSFEYHGKGRFWRHRSVGDMIIDEGASVRILNTERLTEDPVLKIEGTMQVANDAELEIKNEAQSTRSILLMQGGKLHIDDPKRFVLDNKGGAALAWSGSSCELKLKTRQANFWTKESLGGFGTSTIPDFSWGKKDGGILTVDGNGVTSYDLRTVTSNYISGQDLSTKIIGNIQYNPLNANNFATSKAKIIAFGKFLPIDAGYDDKRLMLDGETKPYSDVTVQTIVDEQKCEVRKTTRADDEGKFQMELDEESVLSEHRLQSFYGYLYSLKTEPIMAKLLLEVPEKFEFETVSSNGRTKVIPRLEDYMVKVIDNRVFNKSSWKLSVTATPFYQKGEDGTPSEGQKRAVGNLVFKQPDGEFITLENQEYPLVLNPDGGSSDYSWNPNEGFFAKIDTAYVDSQEDYQATLTWILSEVP